MFAYKSIIQTTTQHTEAVTVKQRRIKVLFTLHGSITAISRTIRNRLVDFLLGCRVSRVLRSLLGFANDRPLRGGGGCTVAPRATAFLAGATGSTREKGNGHRHTFPLKARLR